MKLLSRDQIESLAKFKSEKFLTSSFFLDTKKRKKTKKEIDLAVKSLLNQAKKHFPTGLRCPSVTSKGKFIQIIIQM